MVDFTKEEEQFMFENIAALNVPLNNPNATQIAALGQSCLAKLKQSLEAPEPMSRTAKAGDQ